MSRKGRASVLLTGLVGFGEKSNKDKIQKRLKSVLQRPENNACSDCSLPEPNWVCLLVNPVNRQDFQLGILCCQECATNFHDLGSDVCAVKSTNEEFTEEEVKALECTGNEVVRYIYEAKLSGENYYDERKKKGFIRHKYQTLKFFSKKFYEEHHAAILEMESQKDDPDDDRKRKKAEKADKKAQKEEEKKAREERKKLEKDQKKKKKEVDIKAKYSSLGALGGNRGEDESMQDMQDSSFMVEDTTERHGNSESLLSYQVKSIEDDEDAEQTNSERNRQPLRRRRSGRGLQQLTGDPLAAQSDHVPMMRRGRSSRGPSGSFRNSEKAEAGESVKRPAASHSPVPGRINRPGGRNSKANNDPLASQSDHVSTSRRKRTARLKDIVWDPSHVPEESLNGSRIITASAIANAQQSMAMSFEQLGFEDIDYDAFQDQVAPGQFGGAAAPSQGDQDAPTPNASASELNYDDSDASLGDEFGEESEPDLASEPESAKPKRKSSKSKHRKRDSLDNLPKPGEPVTLDDIDGDLGEPELRRVNSSGGRKSKSTKGDGKDRPRRKKSEHASERDGDEKSSERKQKHKSRRKRSENGDEAADGNEEDRGEGRRRRTPARSSSREMPDGRERKSIDRTHSGSEDRQAPSRSKSDSKPRRGDRRVSTAHMSRRAKLNASNSALGASLNFAFDHLAANEDDEEEEEEEFQDQSTGELEDEKEEEATKKTSKKGTMAKFKETTAGLVKGTIGTIATIDPRKKRASDEPVSDDESINLTATACAG